MKACPKCGGSEHRSTYVGYVGKDENEVICAACGWKGKAYMMDTILFKNRQPCVHPGCLHHVTHPCEGCGRIQAKGIVILKGEER
jgi:hypothetical protein